MFMRFKALTLEITRKCNLQCRHCMRGDAKDTDMGYGVLTEVFKNTSRIDHLTISGGEPSLTPMQIQYIVWLAKEFNCKIGNFFCATNAKRYVPHFMEALNSLYEICNQKEKCVLTVTTDQFHEMPSPEALKQYRKLLFYKPMGEKGTILAGSIINRGKAMENGLGAFDIPVSHLLYDVDITGWDLEFGERIYINALGDVLLDSDLSYKKQAEHSMGNITKELFSEILLSHSDFGKDEPNGVIYKLSINATEHTMAEEALTDNKHYSRYQEAMSAYQSISANIHMTPSAEKTGNTKVVMKELPIKDNIATVNNAVFHYYDLDDTKLGEVYLSLDRIRLEDKA